MNVEAEERKALIRRYRDGHRAIVEALEGLRDDVSWIARLATSGRPG